MITIDEILKAVVEYNPTADVELIKKSFEFSAKAHAGQKRRSGEPYLIHPLDVAKVLVGLKMDIASIAAAILHDTIEDTPVTKDEIGSEFGDEVADLVDGVTKISKIKFSSQEDRQAENYRKLILAMSKDIRVIMIKLADRLSNMRTLQYMPEAKQVRISQETLDIYGPIAARMGINWIKEELEDLSFKFLKPDIYQQIQSRTTRLLQNRETYMKRVIDTVANHLKDAIGKYDITGRVKRSYSVYRKMQQQEISLDDVHDLLAFRILVDNIEHCYEVLGSIHALWRPIQGRFKDYIAMPKANNYQSLHTTVVCFDGERVEFQIRTFEMHETAEKGIAAHWKYKEGGRLDTKDEAKFNWIRELVNWQKELTDSLEFVDTFKMDLFEEEIFVFTPKGDLKRLCRNATPVDFAYAVHSDVGMHCSGSRVNGRIVPLSHRLESGDTVEVITNKNHVPSKDWLDFVESSKAKAEIRQHIRKEQRQKSLIVGKNLLETACQKRRVTPSNLLKMPEFETWLVDKKIPDIDEFYIALAYGKIGAKEMIEAVMPAPKGDEVSDEEKPGSMIKRIFDKVASRNRNLVLVDQQGDVLVTFGKCCAPVKGDAIVGFVSRGRGVIVHRSECPKVLENDPELRVMVDWNHKADQVSLARVLVITEDRKGMLADITKVISEKNVNINKVLVRNDNDTNARITFDLSVRDTTELRKVLLAIEGIKSVLRVIRQ